MEFSPIGDAEYHLTVARALIDKPEKWCQGGFHKGDSFCAAGALREPWMTKPVREEYYGESRAAELLAKAVGIYDFNLISRWNDAPERTHAEVLAAYDRAIAEARRLGV